MPNPDATTTANAATPSVPKSLAYRIDDTCLALDGFGSTIELVHEARVGQQLREAYHSQRARLERCAEQGTEVTGESVLADFRARLHNDPLAHRLLVLADETAEAAQSLRKAASEAGVGLSVRP